MLRTQSSTAAETDSQNTRRRAQEAVQEAMDRRDNGGDGATSAEL
jgi:hypothetical protein